MALSQQLSFLSGDSTMARLMCDQDWERSPLGPPQLWPLSLRSVVSLMLGSGFPMFVAWGPQLAQLYNDAYIDVMGAKHPAGLGQPLLENWAEIAADVGPLAQRALNGDSPYIENMPLRMRRGRGDADGGGDGEDTWFTFSYSPLRDDNGLVVGMFCACIETTATVLAQRDQRAQQRWLETLFHQAPGFAAVLRGPNHVFEMVNEAYKQITGHRDLMGKTVAQALPEVVDQGFIGWLDSVFTSGEAFIGRSMPVTVQQQADGAPYEAFIDFMYQPLKDATGRVEGIFVQGHDVTEQHRARQALLAFSNSIPAIAWVAAADGRLERLNSQWTVYTSKTEQDSLEFGWIAALHPDDQHAPGDAWKAARDSASEWQTEYRLRRHDGVYRWFFTRAVPQLNAAGQVLYWFGTTTDIEDAKRTSEALRDADRQKDEFLATLAHELRNPLAPIRSAVQLLTSPSATPTARERATAVIGRQVGHMAHLLDDLIDISRVTQRRLVLKKDVVHVQDLVDTALETVRPSTQAKQQTLTATVAEGAVHLVADPVRMAQVLSNLLNNASKYTDRGGHIALDVQLHSGALSFVVTDSGIGMSQSAIQTVFSMFAQEQAALDRSEGGLGIGLALVKGIVELHGGTVSAYSDGAGLGSRFVVTLPCSGQGGVPPAASPQSLPAAMATARTVLLADDNLDAVSVLAELLRLDGHTVHTASDGVQAMALAEQLRPDVLVLDIGMPGLNGYQVARQVRTQPWGRRLLLVAATGWGQDNDRQAALDAGFDRHLTKPFDPLMLSALIAEHDAV